MRSIDVKLVTEAVKSLCIQTNYYLSEDMQSALHDAKGQEQSPLGKHILHSLCENLEIASKEMLPICQDTGMSVVFLEIGQEVHFENGYIIDAVHEGVRRGYKEGYLRKSIVGDPLKRRNTGDNTPAIIHTEIVPGEALRITVAPKGAGSENMSKVYMLKPADGIQGVKEAVLLAVREAGANACPPFVVGVGIGGTFEKSALLSKRALLRAVDVRSPFAHVKSLEEELLQEINRLNIGPSGLGGSCTAFAVNIEVYATHIAALPVAVNICCHANRHASVLI